MCIRDRYNKDMWASCFIALIYGGNG